VAAALGVDQPTISRWESDKTRPSPEQISACLGRVTPSP